MQLFVLRGLSANISGKFMQKSAQTSLYCGGIPQRQQERRKTRMKNERCYFINVPYWCIFSLITFVYRRMPACVDSDMSSEMVLGKLLSEEHRPITKSWYYSTEIRVLNTQLLYAFFFQFVKSWKVVRILATAVLHLILTGSVIYCCNQAGYRKESILIAVICFIPLTQDYYYIMLMGCYYVPCISISFLTLGLCMAYAKSRKIEGLLIVGILAFLAGLGGIRQIVILYFPLLICCVVMGVMEIPKNGWKNLLPIEKYSNAVCSLVGLACTMGYLIQCNIFAKEFLFPAMG